MAAYDSDSSGGEDGAYTETGTLLGYASKEPTDDTVSQLGGYPTWLDGKTGPSGALAKCKVCNDLLSLLLQLNGDLPERFAGHERRLYLFSCRRKTCRRKDGSIRGVRGSRVSKCQRDDNQKAVEPKEAPVQHSQPNVGSQLFGGPSQVPSTTANPFSASSGLGALSNPFSTSNTANPFAGASSLAAKPAQRPDPAANLPETFASKARISSSTSANPSFQTSASVPVPHEPWPSESAFPPAFPKNHLDADYETLSAPPTPKLPPTQGSLDGIDMAGSSSGGGGEDKQLFESSMDKTFQKFADRMAQNPEQVLRYEFGGQPMLYSTMDAVGKLLSATSTNAGPSVKVSTASATDSRIPKCTNCGSERVFELQLTPHAIAVLEEDEMSLEGMDWGTVIMGVCSEDCTAAGVKEGEVGYLEEWVGVQWEEVTERRKR